MPTINGIDVPLGLLDLWNALMGTLPFNSGNTLRLNHTAVTQNRRVGLLNRSLFVVFQSIYNGLSSGQKSLWTAYWESLPFGSHAGANGYPGSAFSGFIYFNAPRYKLGLSLILDAPLHNLIKNGDFSEFSVGWQFANGAGVYRGQLHLDGLPNPFDAPNAQTFSLYLIPIENDATYVFSGYRKTDSLAKPNFSLLDPATADLFNSWDIPAGTGEFSHTFTFHHDDNNLAVLLYSNNAPSSIILDILSLVKLP